jgi:hypothetical protein
MGKIVNEDKDTEWGKLSVAKKLDFTKSYVEDKSNNFTKNIYKLSTLLSHNPTKLTVPYHSQTNPVPTIQFLLWHE